MTMQGHAMSGQKQADEEEPEEPAPGSTTTLACIFKVGDDVRQDVLALQVRNTCMHVWACGNGLGCILFL